MSETLTQCTKYVIPVIILLQCMKKVQSEKILYFNGTVDILLLNTLT